MYSITIEIYLYTFIFHIPSISITGPLYLSSLSASFLIMFPSPLLLQYLACWLNEYSYIRSEKSSPYRISILVG